MILDHNSCVLIPVAALSMAWIYSSRLMELWTRLSVFCECCVVWCQTQASVTG